MIESISLSTRQYVKRQMTWFRGNKDIKWIYLDDKTYDDIHKQSMDYANKKLNSCIGSS